jgi:8-oxo-dGTP diphosphatase
MNTAKFDLKYNVGFPIKDDMVLMIRRNKYPWIGQWNGAGGKIEAGETPEQAMLRELLEETTIDLSKAAENRFVGIVTWEWDNREPTKLIPGMYAYLSFLSPDQKTWPEERKTREGIVAWKSISWACDTNNKELAHNLPHFLPLMLKADKPMRYHCIFTNDVLKNLVMTPL